MIADELNASDHRRLAQFVAKTAGIQLPENKKSLIESRLRHRQIQLGHATLGEYIDYALDHAPQEQPLLIDALTTNKTDFFREQVHFDVLASQLKPLLASHSNLNIWSAGCSTGEEPYTIAMVLDHHRPSAGGYAFHILATDISISCLAYARQATYSAERIEPVPERFRRRYLLRSRDPQRQLIRIAPEVRSTITFAEFNLIRGNFSQLDLFDVIFCRNVMIYFSTEQRRRLIERFRGQLNAGGLLFVGLSEGISANRELFHQISPSVYRKHGN
ncbi:MAG TPA: protein-glutamate O-methyltransferase CheR [Dongiaceae bacterium]|nr:protein-glutamate O-methyltransferase CheR [Dongiaceae bacterium]